MYKLAIITAAGTGISAVTGIVLVWRDATMIPALLGGLVPGLIIALLIAVYHRRKLRGVFKALHVSRHPQTTTRAFYVEEDNPAGVIVDMDTTG